MNPACLTQRPTDVPDTDEWLGEAEQALLAPLRLPKRRHEWRLGRWTAKRLLAQWSARCGRPADLRSLQVLPAADGGPEAFLNGRLLPLSLSISHRDDWGFAALCDAPAAIGCDVEKIEEREASFAVDYLAAPEVARLSAIPKERESFYVTLVWSAKESALKALREGLRRDTRTVEVMGSFSGDRGDLAVLCHLTGRRLEGRWWTESGCVFTLVSDPAA